MNEVVVEGDSDEYSTLVRAYILGDKLQDGDFKNTIMDAMVEKRKTGCYPEPPLVRHVYENTPDSSKIQLFLVDIYVIWGTSSWIDKKHNLPEAFIHRILCAFFDMKDRSTYWHTVAKESRECRYHQHGAEGALCCKDCG